MARIVLTTMGSLGDVLPYVGIGVGLKGRGHEVVVATGERYRGMVEGWGLEFAAVRPEWDWRGDARLARRMTDRRWGLVRVGREWLLPALRESYADTLEAARGADLIVSQVPWAARLVAEKTGVGWVSSVHIPVSFFSAWDLPVIPPANELTRYGRWLGPGVWGPVLRGMKRATRPVVARPIDRLREELGLPRAAEDNPVVDSHSPELVLALFSEVLAAKQVDWPGQTVVTGFPWFDGGGGLSSDLERWLDAGAAPVVFTLGSAVSAVAGRFFEESVGAARRLGRRAVLVTNGDGARFEGGVAVVGRAAFSELFPRAVAVVHHGGVGTTGWAMRAGRPMVVMPVAWDQPDHAARVERLGIARVIGRRWYRARRVAREVGRVLEDGGYEERARAVGEVVRGEDGVGVACGAIEGVLGKGRGGGS